MASLAPYSITLGATDYPVKYAGLLAYIEPYLTNLETFSFSGTNVGLGVTPSAWGSGNKAIEQIGGALFSGATSSIFLGQNTFFDTAWKYKNTAAATYYQQTSGEHRFWTAPSGTAGNTISFTQAMTLDASGRLCVGVTTPINNNVISAYGAGQNGFVSQVTNNANSNFQGFNSSGVATFQVLGSGIAQFLSAAAGTLNYVEVGRTVGEARIGAAASTNDFLTGTSAGDAVFYKVTAGNAWYGTAASGAAIFTTNNAERARFTVGGAFWLGRTTDLGGAQILVEGSVADFQSRIRNTSATTPAGLFLHYTAAAPNGTGSLFLRCDDNAATRVEIRSNGGLANFSANNVNLSDARLKTGIQLAGDYLAKICAIPVKTFLYRDQQDDERNLGVIAQDVAAVAPELVDHSGFGQAPEGEEPYLAIYQTDLQYALMRAIQELAARVHELERA